MSSAQSGGATLASTWHQVAGACASCASLRARVDCETPSTFRSSQFSALSPNRVTRGSIYPRKKFCESRGQAGNHAWPFVTTATKIIFCCAARSLCDQCCDTDCRREGVPIGDDRHPALTMGVVCGVQQYLLVLTPVFQQPSALIATNPHLWRPMPGCDGDHKKHVCPSWRRTSRVVASTNAHVAPMAGPLSTNRRL
jgi:hypothetical protein